MEHTPKEAPPSPSKVRRFSLKLLFGVLTFAPLVLGISAYRQIQIARHTAAVSAIEDSGGRVTITEWKDNSSSVVEKHEDLQLPLISTVWTMPPVSIPHVDLTDPSLTTDKVRELIPHLEASFREKVRTKLASPMWRFS